jgi:hypothetical protein
MLIDKIKTIYSSLTDKDFLPIGTIQIQDDGNGQYIAKWEHPTLARPTDEELA